MAGEKADDARRRKAWLSRGTSAGPEPVANSDLRLFHLPPRGAPLSTVFHFALSYPGYDEAGKEGNCAEIANGRRGDTLHDLRACLFFEQRRWRHFGVAPEGEDLRYVQQLVERIREKVKAAGRGEGAGVHRLDPEVFKRAIDLAARSHGGQKVPGSGFPYVVHLTKVAMEVAAATETDPACDRDFAIACALLHDTLEDSAPEDRPGIEDRIRMGFGRAVAEGVLALTKDERIPDKAARMKDSLRRILDQPREVWLVKLADRITNLEPAPPDWSLDKRRGYLREAGAILRALGDASRALSARLERKMREYGQALG